VKVLVILQARLSSKRYPKKVFHELWNKKLIEAIIDRQSATLCNNYLRDKGYEYEVNFMVATSNENSDDELVNVLIENDVIFYRGSLTNVLQRYVDSVKYFENTFDKKVDIICRVTADNISPDYIFIADHIIWFIENNLDYGVSSEYLPEGLKCELFRKSHLFSAEKEASSDYEKEHVTPYIIKNFKNSFFRMKTVKEGPFLSLTLDTKEDAFRIEQIIFEKKLSLMSNWQNFLKNV